MGDKTGIAWSEATWNPLVGCSRVSEGCRHCYAEREAAGRLSGTPKYQGLAREVNGHASWTGEVRLWPAHLEQPLRWRKPRLIFVNSMSDLFHEAVRDEWIAAIFGVMLMAGHHTYQILTKRPERMARWCQWLQRQPDQAGILLEAAADLKRELGEYRLGRAMVGPWPKPHIWLGVSVEDQATADARIPLLLQTPAAVRWVSYEPALGPVAFSPWLAKAALMLRGAISRGEARVETDWLALDWIVVGGESGPGARPFDVAWARQTIAQGRAAEVPVFVKQLGAITLNSSEELGPWPLAPAETMRWSDRKGGDMAEWPEDLRVREYPTPKGVST